MAKTTKASDSRIVKKMKTGDGSAFDNRKRSTSCPFSLLDDDSLRAILVRTQTSDHPNLRLSCKRVRRVLDSPACRRERSDRGWAEVKVKLIDSFEQYKKAREEDKKAREEEGYYDEDDSVVLPPSRNDKEFLNNYDRLGQIGDYGEHNFSSHNLLVLVDGCPLHKYERNRDFWLKLKLLPRKSNCFYENCDVHSHDLAEVGTTLFTNKGNPSVECLKNALPNDNRRRGLLYISDFHLPREYRFTCSTVGPLILQEILRVLKDEYSVAIYIPCGKAQYSLQDSDLFGRSQIRNPGMEPTDQEIRQEEERNKRYSELTNQDMRQFFRAGFRQVDDAIVVNKSKNSFVFVTRQQQGSAQLDSLLTEKQALDLPIASPPPPPKPKTGLPKELFSLLKKRCPRYKELLRKMTQPLVIPPRLRRTFTAEQLRSRESAAREEATLAFNECQRSTVEATQQVLDQCETFEDRFRVIRDSEAIHLCAAFENMTFINMLLERLPKPSSQTRIVLNHLDKDGCTPLMVCARNIPKMRELHDADDAEKAREFLQSIIRLGAAVYVAHATTGLSPLGYFREEFRDYARWHDMNGIEDPDAEARQVQADQIETILMPGSGATEADDAVVRADREDRAMNDFDEEEWDEEDWGGEEINEEEWQDDEGDY